jgi:hypothetical protein
MDRRETKEKRKRSWTESVRIWDIGAERDVKMGREDM